MYADLPAGEHDRFLYVLGKVLSKKELDGKFFVDFATLDKNRVKVVVPVYIGSRDERDWFVVGRARNAVIFGQMEYERVSPSNAISFLSDGMEVMLALVVVDEDYDWALERESSVWDILRTELGYFENNRVFSELINGSKDMRVGGALISKYAILPN